MILRTVFPYLNLFLFRSFYLDTSIRFIATPLLEVRYYKRFMQYALGSYTRYACDQLLKPSPSHFLSRTQALILKLDNWILKLQKNGYPLSSRHYQKWLFFLFRPTSHKRQFYGVMRGFTRLIMETKYVFNGLNSSHATFRNIRITWTKFH